MVAALDEALDNQAEEESLDDDGSTLLELSRLDFDLFKVLIPTHGIPTEVGALLHQRSCSRCEKSRLAAEEFAR